MESKHCINCDSPAQKYSDYCVDCEGKELSKIGGFLYMPAIGVVISIFTFLFSSYRTVMVLSSSYSFIGGLKPLVYFEAISLFLLFLLSFYTAVLFFKKNKKTPRYYILLLLSGLIYALVDTLWSHHGYNIELTKDDYSRIFRTLVSCCIWVPYFIVSVRVKRTFVRG